MNGSEGGPALGQNIDMGLWEVELYTGRQFILAQAWQIEGSSYSPISQYEAKGSNHQDRLHGASWKGLRYSA